MYEFHGWINIIATATIEEVEEATEEENIAKIKNFAGTLKDTFDNNLIAIHAVNAQFHLVVGGSTCQQKEISNLFNLYTYTGMIASGSYGILYVRQNPDFDNEFQVYSLVRGKLNKHRDPFSIL